MAAAATSRAVFFPLLLLVLACGLAAAHRPHRNDRKCYRATDDCGAGKACLCKCGRHHGRRLATIDADPAADANTTAAARHHHHKNDGNSGAGQIGDACAPPGYGSVVQSCARRLKCSCSCAAYNLSPKDDYITLVDTGAPNGLGVVTLNVLANDAAVSGAASLVARGASTRSDNEVAPLATLVVTSVRVRTPDAYAPVELLGTTPDKKGVQVRVPRGANSFHLRYTVQDTRLVTATRGETSVRSYSSCCESTASIAVIQLSSSSSRASSRAAASAATATYPLGTDATRACQGYGTCKGVFEASDFKANNECTQGGGRCELPQTTDTCVRHKWLGSRSSSYCLPDMRDNCETPETAGCARCALYQLARKCAGGGAGTTDCRRFPDSTAATHVVIRNSERGSSCNCAGPTSLCLCTKHWLAMPTTACNGIEDSGQRCTGDDSLALWKDAYAYGTSKLGRSNSWALQINAADQRTQQHVHIHIAPIESSSGPVGVMRSAASIAGTVASPQRFPASGSGPYLLAAFFPGATVSDIKIGGKIRPFEQALLMHYNHFTNAEEAANTPYGVGVLPHHKGGIVLFAAYGFGDRDYMSLELDTVQCVSQCAAFAP